jgi:hypothetical protein
MLAVVWGGLLATVALPAVYAAPPSQITPGCINLIENGDFEISSPSWQIQPGPQPPVYTGEATFNGSRQAMRLGNGPELPNSEGISEIRYLPILFPVDATRLILRFRYLPRFDAAAGNDLQQADLHYYAIDQLALPVLNVQENSSDWKLVERDLSAFRGQLISLRLRVRNDGQAGRTWLYIDNVELEYCSSDPIPPTPTRPPAVTPTNTAVSSPTPLPTATPPPPPTVAPTVPPPVATPPAPNCPNLLSNGSFELESDWYIGEDPVHPRYTNEAAHSGSRSIVLGHPPGGANVETYSSIRQLVTLPATGALQLRWWQLAYSQAPPSTNPQPPEDRQEVILLNPDLTTLTVLSRARNNSNTWQEQTLDLTPYRGRTVYLYFNVFNDADNARTWLYLDDVALYNYGTGYECAQTLPQAPIQPVPAPQSGPPFTPALQPQTATVTPGEPATPPATAEPIAVQLTPAATAVATAQGIPATIIPTPTATPAGAVVAVITTTSEMTVGGAGGGVVRATPTPVPRTVGLAAWWRERLGTLAILCSIPVVILIILILIAQIRRERRNAAPNP